MKRKIAAVLTTVMIGCAMVQAAGAEELSDGNILIEEMEEAAAAEEMTIEEETPAEEVTEEETPAEEATEEETLPEEMAAEETLTEELTAEILEVEEVGAPIDDTISQFEQNGIDVVEEDPGEDEELIAGLTDVYQLPGNTYNRMFRMFSPSSGEHLYTADVVEVQYIVQTLGWLYEGESWLAPVTGGDAIVRLYNPDPNYSEHHYTSNQNEIDYLVSQGWNNEGVKWYSDPNEGVPVYRLFNPDPSQPSSASHHYTKDINERDYLVSIGWNYEGIAWYGMASAD